MPDNRIPTNQSQIDIKDSIDLLTANINRTASNIPYDSNLTIKGKIDGTPEIITNANGTAYKFPSGLMICTKTISDSIPNASSWSAWGSLYTAEISGGNWAEPFYSKPCVAISNNSDDSAFMIGELKAPTSTGYEQIYIVRPNAVYLLYSISLIAIGRWKA